MTASPRSSHPPDTSTLPVWEIIPQWAASDDVALRCRAAQHPELPREHLVDLSHDDSVRVRRWIAQREDAPGDVLRQLAEDINSIQKQVARNANTPADVLIKLSEGYPRDLARNPALALLLVEPERMQQIPRSACLQIASVYAVDLAWLRWAAHSSDVDLQRKAALHSRTPPDALLHLCDAPVTIQQTVAGRAVLPEDVAERLSRSPSVFVREQLAQGECWPPPVFWRLAADESEIVRRSVATNPETPPNVLWLTCARDPSSHVRCAAAQNSSAPTGMVKSLTKDEDPSVRSVARKRLRS
jgi:hypothetical protein